MSEKLGRGRAGWQEMLGRRAAGGGRRAAGGRQDAEAQMAAWVAPGPCRGASSTTAAFGRRKLAEGASRILAGRCRCPDDLPGRLDLSEPAGVAAAVGVMSTALWAPAS